MLNEIEALGRNNTWSLVPRPAHRNVLNYHWVFRLKQDKHGDITTHKARLVANRMKQIDGVDVEETFSPRREALHDLPHFINCHIQRVGSTATGRVERLSSWCPQRRSVHAPTSWFSR